CSDHSPSRSRSAGYDYCESAPPDSFRGWSDGSRFAGSDGYTPCTSGSSPLYGLPVLFPDECIPQGRHGCRFHTRCIPQSRHRYVSTDLREPLPAAQGISDAMRGLPLRPAESTSFPPQCPPVFFRDVPLSFSRVLRQSVPPCQMQEDNCPPS